MSYQDSNNSNAIAIVGMACRFPGAQNLHEFWQLLRDGVEAVTTFTEEELRASGIAPSDYTAENYVPIGTVIADQDCFDAAFFGMSATEAALLDPQHRLFLQCSWHALEDAAHLPEHFQGAVGVFAGSSLSAYLHKNLHERFDPYTHANPAEMLQVSIGNEPDYLATQVSYKLDLKGPAISVQTACSTSLVAVHLACQSLLLHECDLALAGGATLRVPQKQGYFTLEDGPFSPDGHCRTFDAEAAGTLFSQGVGVVALRRLTDALADGDHIYAIIRGTAINNDGAGKVGFTAPSVEGQVRVITEALAVAEVEPESISYIEAHGTATPLGDPIEVEALTRVFGRQAEKKCLLGSVKTNIGHAETAAGIAGLIKTALALHHRQIPPSLHFKRWNPRIQAEQTPFAVNTELVEWQHHDTPRRAGVSSFGFGGTNAHVVLEEAPESRNTQHDDSPELFVFSARTRSALHRTVEQFAEHLTDSTQAYGDIACTLQMGRRAFRERSFIVASGREQALEALRQESGALWVRSALQEQPEVVFLFPGGGSQHIAMGSALYARETAFRHELDRCAEMLYPYIQRDIRQAIYQTDKHGLLDPAVALPALFAVEYALARQWMAWGVEPAAMIGHSLGEYTAATLAGVMSLADALKLVAARSQWMAKIAHGVMATIPLPYEEVRVLAQSLDIAAVNGPALCVVSGTEEEIAELERQLQARDVQMRRLPLAAGAHSRLVEPFMASLEEVAASLTLRPPQIPYISNVTGTWVTAEQVTRPAYWAEHLRCPVQFSQGLQALLTSPRLFLEVGPGTTLTTLLRQHPEQKAAIDSIASMRHPKSDDDDYVTLLNAAGRLWCAGVPLQWEALHGERWQRVSLPLYPFERERHWIEPEQDAPSRILVQVPAWKETAPVPLLPPIPQESVWLIVGNPHGLGEELLRQIQPAHALLVQEGDAFGEHEAGFTVRSGHAADFEQLFQRLTEQQIQPRYLLYLPALAIEGQEAMKRLLVDFASLLASQGRSSSATCTLLVALRGSQKVESSDRMQALYTPLHALSRIAQQEYPFLQARTVDLPVMAADAAARLLIAEAVRETEDTEVAYRGRRRWDRQWETLELPVASLRLREQGVYLITGGLGDIGLQLAQRLALRAPVKLALLGRHTVSADAKNAQRTMQIIQQIRESGSEVLPVTADVADLHALQEALDQVRRHFGALHGVIHAAGVIGHETFVPLADLSMNELEAQFQAKVSGTLNLDWLLWDEVLDFRVLISSVATTVGGVGLGAYAAANAFLDGMAQETNGRWLSIAWDGWLLDKPDEDTAFSRGLMHHAMRPDEALDMFERILAHAGSFGLSSVAVSPSSLSQRMKRRAEKRPLPVQPIKSNAIHDTSIPPANELERAMCVLWEETLGVSPIGRHDDFFELGGHSLLASGLVARIRERFGISFKLSDLLRATTVARLSAALAELLEMHERKAEVQVEPTINAAQQSEPFPLTQVQHAYWVGRGSTFDLGNVASHVYFEFDCPSLDLERYTRAWNRLIQRHEMLRMVVLPDGRQQILPTVPAYQIAVEDLRGVSDEEQTVRLNARREQLSHHMVNVERWPLFAIEATRLNEQITRLHLSLDVLICDAASYGLLQQELAALYADPERELPPLRYSFRDYVLAEQEQRASAAFEEDARYWLARLDEFVPPQLPLQRSPASITLPRFERRSARLEAALWQRLQKQAAQLGVTSTVFVLTAFADVLGYWSRSARFTLNLTLFNRRPVHPDVMRLIGDFTTLTLLAIDHRAGDDFQHRATRLQARLWEDLDHSLFTAVDVLRELSRGEEQVSMPVVFTSTLGLTEQSAPSDWPGKQVYACSQTPQVWLDHQVFEVDGALLFNWDSVEGLFPPGFLDDMFEVYCTYLRQLAEEQPVESFVPQTFLRICKETNATQEPFEPELLHMAFLRHARQQPERIAVRTLERAWSYGQLERWSGEIARRLQERAVHSGQPIPVLMEKGVEQIAAILGVLRAGAAYVPIDPFLPGERIARLFKNLGATVALTQPRFRAELPVVEHLLEIEWMEFVQCERDGVLRKPEPIATRPDDLAYIIYTSGSTGEPKGVMIEHQSALNTILDVNRRFALTAEDCVLGLSALNFDLSVWDIFGLLGTGGSLLLPDPEGVRDPAHWLELMQRHKVTIWNTAPALMEMLVMYLQPRELASSWTEHLRLVLLSGDWIALHLPERVRSLFPRAQIVSLGGATEASIWSICYPIEQVEQNWKSIPYGKPMQNQRFYVLNERLQPCPCFVTGRLYIGGVGLARGYWNDPQKTAERFIIHPETGERLYETGDLGRYLPDGTIEFLGREDFQVKINGHRIELEEIEATLMQHEAVSRAVVTVMGERFGLKQLLAYALPEPVADPEGEEKQRWQELIQEWEAVVQSLPVPQGSTGITATLARLEEVLLFSVCQALRDLGVFTGRNERYTFEELMQRSTIRPRYRKWLQRNIHLLHERGYLHVQGDMIHAEEPLPVVSLDELWQAYRDEAARAEDDALRDMAWLDNIAPVVPAHVRGLADVLTERLHSAEVYATEEMANSYRFFHYCNQMAAEVMRRYLERRPTEKPLRVLEIGAGYGTTTRFLLPLFPPEQTTFVYTDISRYFLEHAHKQFAAYPYVEYRLLNIEQNPQVQGFDLHAFDIVIASSVLHATADIAETLRHIQSLLATDGVLLLIEETRFHRAFDLSMGLQQGFDRFEDRDTRQEHPLLSREQWRQIVQAHGFELPVILNRQGSVTDFFGFDVILTRNARAVRPLDATSLRDFLRERLPEYMVPAYIIPLDILPLTQNGKVDRRMLPVPHHIQRDHQSRPPQSLIEQCLAHLWIELLHIDKVSLDDSFFRMGGDSLSAVRLVSGIRDTFKVELSLRQIFACKSLEALAATIEKRMGEQHVSVSQLVTTEEDEPFPLADLQQAYWIGQQHLYELSYNSAHFYIDFETRGLDVTRLERALQRLVAHQPMLRCEILPDGRQRIRPEVEPYRVLVTDLRALSADGQQRAITALRDRMIQMGPRNEQQLLFEIRVQQLDEQRSRVHLCCSLLIADGWSFYIFFYELFQLYNDEQLELPPLEVTFRDYVLALQQMEQEERYKRARHYWQERIKEFSEAPQLPLACDPASVTNPQMTRRSFSLDAARWRRLKERCGYYEVTVSAVLCALYAEVLARWSQEPRFTLNMLYFNRQPLHPGLDRVLGPFSSTMPIVADLRQRERFVERVRHFQMQFAEALEHSLYSGIRVLRDLVSQRGGTPRPLLPVVFTSTVGFDSAYKHVPTDMLTIEDVFERVRTPQVWLDQQVLEEDGELLVNWDAVEAIFPAGMLDEMFAMYQETLLRLVDDADTWEAQELIQRAVSSPPQRRPSPVHGELRSGSKRKVQKRRDADALEEQIASLCTKLLDVPSLGVDENFFERGGNSLFIVRLLVALEQQLHYKVPAAALFQSPTVEGVAQEIRNRYMEKNVDPVVLLRSGEGAPPLFCVHPSGGDVMSYLELARLLDGKRPFIGLQDPAVYGAHEAADLQEMAARYMQALRRIQPHGPYLLGGWSMGGMIAYEMACQLQAEGEKIALLALIDSHEPSMVVRQYPWKGEDRTLFLMLDYVRSLELFLAHSREGTTGERFSVAEADFLRLSPDEAQDRVIQWMKRVGLVHSRTADEDVARRIKVACHHILMLRKYIPSRFRGEMVLIRAGERSPVNSQVGVGVDDNFADPYLGWGSYVQGKIVIHTVDGHHYTLVRRPAVEELATILRQYLSDKTIKTS
uniref:Phenolphthiocerol/phthiocerol polyketide synthase subunit E n=1 Tax=Thermosporothrix sp. COM3 TaxID=2490863 RepID=A0A455SK91_9CHLR|nr:hypothetical protein KTC_27910 [Thermosporothrix sp. COM3]